MRIRFINPILKIINKGVIRLNTPSNLSYFWNFGSLLGLCLIIQIITGILLSMHYNPEVNMAFSSISHILRDVNEGWKIKIIHANGASMFFILVYLHISRGIYYGSYLKKPVWNIGIILFFLMMIISFLGYVLPWGQMSFWGATVITNFISTIPYIGNELVFWIWGGFSVAQPTLNRFFSLHYLFPFILIFFVLLHITYLHINGSSNPLGVRSIYDRIPFHPYYILKDLNGVIICLFIFLLFVFIYPNLLGDPENYIKANSLVTPKHIMPEWYFLFAYAILRAMPNKLGGVILLVCSILILFILPFFHTSKHETLTFKPLSNFIFWLFISNFFFLTWVGSKPIMMPYIMWAMISTHLYFIVFLLLFPITGILENYIYIYRQIFKIKLINKCLN